MEPSRGDRASRFGLRFVYFAFLAAIALTQFASYRATRRGNAIGERIQATMDSTRQERRIALETMSAMKDSIAAGNTLARDEARAARVRLDALYRRMSTQVSNVGKVADTLKAAIPRKNPRR